MASFNLGQVKGEKGDKGDTGAKGERGEKGEKGETGERGKDGRTPVFTIGETVTISPDEEAYAELDTSDIENPVLSFFIPRGHDGRDAGGDMISAIYDTEGKGEDFYKYADSLFEKSLKKEDTTTEKLTVGEAEGKTAVVRNISMRSTLPEVALEGDICIVTEDENSKKLGYCEVGSTMLIAENGVDAEYTIIAKDYHEENSVTLMRKEVPPLGIKFSYQNRDTYAMSNIDLFLTTYPDRFSNDVRKNLVCAKLNVNDSKFCFSLSKEELETIDYLKENANRIEIGSLDDYYTRTISGDRVYVVSSTGALVLLNQSVTKKYRPVIVLPSSVNVENVANLNAPAVKMAQTKKGIYAFLGGEWKECALL